MNHLDTYIVYLDDALYAQQELEPLLRQWQPKRFVLVACAPRMTRRIGKWLSHASRENWRKKWCDRLFAQFVAMVRREDTVLYEIATGPLHELTEMLLKDLGQAQVIDVRRPKFGVDLAPVVAPPALATTKTADTRWGPHQTACA